MRLANEAHFLKLGGGDRFSAFCGERFLMRLIDQIPTLSNMVAKNKGKPVNVNRFGRTGGKKKVGSENDKAKEALLL